MSTETDIGQPVSVSLTVGNVPSNPDIDVYVVLEAPSGMSLSGNSCPSGGQCAATYKLGGGQSEVMELNATSDKDGIYVIKANVIWNSPSDATLVQTVTRSLELNVRDPSATPTPTPTQCNWNVPPSVRLSAGLTEITVTEEAMIDLHWNNSGLNDMATEIEVSVDVPENLLIYAEDGAMACAAGRCIGRFTAIPESSRHMPIYIKALREGSYSIQLNARYWPEGCPDKWNPESLTTTIDVGPPVVTPPPPPPPPTPTDTPIPIPTTSSTGGEKPEIEIVCNGCDCPPGANAELSFRSVSELALGGFMLVGFYAWRRRRRR